MKTKLILVFIFLTTIGRAQVALPLGAGYNFICFNEEYDDLILIDTNQVWFISQPEKDILNYNINDVPGCGNSAIITDTNKYYSKNLDSYFQIAVSWDYPDDFVIRFQHKYDFQINRDGGIIEISYDEGLNWINIINDTIVVDSSKGNLTGLYTKNDTVFSFNNQPAFTGTQSDLSEVIIPFELRKTNQNNGKAIIRFRIASDSIDSNNEGWMISTIYVDGWLVGIQEISSNPDISLYIDLANTLYVYVKNEEIKELDIYSVDGKLLRNKVNSNSISLSNLERGIYLVLINNSFSRKIMKK